MYLSCIEVGYEIIALVVFVPVFAYGWYRLLEWAHRKDMESLGRYYARLDCPYDKEWLYEQYQEMYECLLREQHKSSDSKSSDN